MSGLLTFPSLDVAIREGFEVCDRFTDGYLVRKRFRAGYQMALVATPKSELRELDDSPHYHFGDPEC